ncbi:MAG: hypothetical protein ACREUZ_02965 [Burkholderiales bacterium]
MQEIVMTEPREIGGDDADIDLDTQELVRPTSEEPLGYGPGEWASGPLPAKAETEPVRTGGSDADVEHRVRDSEAAVERLRATVTGLQREVAMVRADLERLRQESEKAAGSKMP